MMRTSQFVCGCLLALAACDNPAASSSTASSNTAAVSALAGSAAAAAPSKALKTAAPKAYKETAAQALGTLPEGVGIALGERAPDFELHDAKGKQVALKALLVKGPVLLVFYRGGW